MINLKDLNTEILSKWGKTSSIILFRVTSDMNILDCSPNFEKHAQKFKNIHELVTYTHRSEFSVKFRECIQTKSIVDFSTNFSYDNTDVEDIPSTFKIIMQFLKSDEVIIVAELVCPFTHENAKEYFHMVNDYSSMSRKFQKSDYVLNKKNIQLKEQVQELEYLTNYDSLTDIYNRKRIFEELENEYSRYKRLDTVFSIVMIDIDDFKNVNDMYGHQNGDVVLKTFAKVLNSICREYDSIGRYGGEEFLLILPHTEKEDALLLVKRMLKKLNHTKIPLLNNEEIMISFSAGVEQITQKKNSVSLLTDADRLLYKAKEEGKNRVY